MELVKKDSSNNSWEEKYLDSLIKGEIKLDGLEKKILENYLSYCKQREYLNANLQRLRDEIQKAQSLMFELNGRINENAQTLILAEIERRKE
jgi:hypothetical protein